MAQPPPELSSSESMIGAQRRELSAHLRSHGCDFLREGGRRSWWCNPVLNQLSAGPRHVEIGNDLAK
jgi:hypothetical protein